MKQTFRFIMNSNSRMRTQETVCAFARFLSLCMLLVFLGASSVGCQGQEQSIINDASETAPELVYVESVELDYAQCFSIDRYEGGYSVIEVQKDRRYLVVPEGAELPANAEDYIVLQQPLDHLYVAASASMSLFQATDSLDSIRMSSTNIDGWYIDEVKEAMEQEEIIFAGKYSEPDYELLLEEQCSLAVESTMILHAPEVQEKIEAIGIPVFIDYSSYETHPLGRTEWIKVYGELMGKPEEAKTYFDSQKAEVESVTEALAAAGVGSDEGLSGATGAVGSSDVEHSRPTVAFFYVSQSGSIVTRKSSDYVPKMIELAGGKYVFHDLGAEEENAASSVNMTMEEFYANAKDADYIIYNGTIDNPLNSVDELLEKDALFGDFKAVKEGHVWCSGKYLYQATDVAGSMTKDIYTVLHDDQVEELTFMYHVR